MRIAYYRKDTGEQVIGTDYLFVMNDEVYMDAGESYESQAACITFDDLVAPRPDLEWKVQLT